MKRYSLTMTLFALLAGAQTVLPVFSNDEASSSIPHDAPAAMMKDTLSKTEALRSIPVSLYRADPADEEDAVLITGWIIGEDSIAFRKENGELACGEFVGIDGQTYFFDDACSRKTGWLYWSGGWFFLDPEDGHVWKDTWLDGDYLDEQGLWQPSRWVAVQGGWQLQCQDGTLLKNAWFHQNGIDYYLNAAGFMQTGWAEIDGRSYYFDSAGKLLRSKWIDGKWYVDENGVWVKNEWVFSTWTGKWWYKFADGTCCRDTWQTIDGKQYCFDEEGWMKTGWVQREGNWYFLGTDGTITTSQQIGDWYVNRYGVGFTGSDIEIARICETIYDQTGPDLYAVYFWTVDNIQYLGMQTPYPFEDASLSLLQNYGRKGFFEHRGNCFTYAAVFTYLARGLGYDPEFVYGHINRADGSKTPHGWVIMEEDGIRYYYDPEVQYEHRSGNYFHLTREQVIFQYSK